MSPPLDILLIRLWTLGTARIRTSLCASGLTTRITRVDFPAALHAALARRSYSAVIYDPETPSISHELLQSALREHEATAPIVALCDQHDVGKRIAALLLELRN